MDYYCVAKSKEAGFIGQLTLEDITRRFRAGELLGDYVATKSLGLSHHQIMKSGLAAWVTVAALVAHPPVQNKLPANTLVVVWRERTRTPVILTILFAVITAGFYVPCWFLTRRESFNSLNTQKKLTKRPFSFAIAAFFIYVFLSVVSKGLEGTGKELVVDLGKISLGVASIILLVQSFKVKSMMQQHFNEHLGLNLAFSGPAIFFFQIFYLQYKINRLPG